MDEQLSEENEESDESDDENHSDMNSDEMAQMADRTHNPGGFTMNTGSMINGRSSMPAMSLQTFTKNNMAMRKQKQTILSHHELPATTMKKNTNTHGSNFLASPKIRNLHTKRQRASLLFSNSKQSFTVQNKVKT